MFVEFKTETSGIFMSQRNVSMTQNIKIKMINTDPDNENVHRLMIFFATPLNNISYDFECCNILVPFLTPVNTAMLLIFRVRKIH